MLSEITRITAYKGLTDDRLSARFTVFSKNYSSGYPVNTLEGSQIIEMSYEDVLKLYTTLYGKDSRSREPHFLKRAIEDLEAIRSLRSPVRPTNQYDFQ